MVSLQTADHLTMQQCENTYQWLAHLYFFNQTTVKFFLLIRYYLKDIWHSIFSQSINF